MSYLKQYILEQQVQYRGIFQRPVQVVAHLFFTNGGGQCMKGNNFCETASFGKMIPFHQWYADTMTLDEIKSYYTDFSAEREMDEDHKRKLDMATRLHEINSGRFPAPDSDAIWETVVSEFHSEMDAILDFDENCLFDSHWWLCQIKEVQALYEEEYGDRIPGGWMLRLSKDYIPSAKSRNDEQGGLNHRTTEMFMFHMYEAVVEAFKIYYAGVLEKNDPLLDQMTEEKHPDCTVRKIITRDLELLNTLIEEYNT